MIYTNEELTDMLNESYAVIKVLNERIARCKCVDCDKVSSDLLELNDLSGNFQACICERCNENRFNNEQGE
jgi:hypothetical protein